MIDIDEQKKEITEAVATRIRYFRRAQDLSQEQLALRANINPAYFGQVERGLKCPTIDTLYKISKALEIPVAELLRADYLPNYAEDHSQRIKQILSRVHDDKMDQMFKIMEDVVELL